LHGSIWSATEKACGGFRVSAMDLSLVLAEKIVAK